MLLSWQSLCCVRARQPRLKSAGDAALVPRRPETNVDVNDSFVGVSQVASNGMPPDSEQSGKNGNEAKDKVPGWVARTYKQEVAVLVSDLSGFTSTTRDHGIVHFASIVARKRQICIPIMHRHMAEHIGTEADNLIVAFLDATEAVKAALEMRHAIIQDNEALDSDREHFKIKLNGIGVHCAAGALVDVHGNILGEASRIAYTIGEDVCTSGHVIVTGSVLKRIDEQGFFQKASFQQFFSKEVGEQLFVVGGEPGPLVHEQVSFDDARFLNAGLVALAQRCAPSADVATIDRKLHSGVMKTFAVLMFNIDLGGTASNNWFSSATLEDVLALKFQGLSLVTPIFEKHNGQSLEDMLWIFASPEDALLAAVEARSTVDKFNAAQPEPSRQINITGYGIHHGEMLFIEGTDVHWGDPVNTASKLGQDLATNEDILITPGVFQAVQFSSSCDELIFDAKILNRSNVEFNCFSVTEGVL